MNDVFTDCFMTSPEDLTNDLLDLSPYSFDHYSEAIDELQKALTHLKIIAEYSESQHYWTTLWNVLCTLAD